VTDDIRTRILRVLAEHLDSGLDNREVSDETALFGHGLGLSSLDSVSLVIELEDEFEIFLEAEEMSTALESFGKLVAVVTSKLTP
jgi:acyl carrier protein